MTFERIKELANLLPETCLYFQEDMSNSLSRFNDPETVITNVINKFLIAYKDLAFGYKFIKTLIKENIKLPLSVTEDALVDLYQFEKFRIYNDNVVHALSLTHPSNKNIEDNIKAFLITDEPLDKLEKVLGIKKEVLHIYEQLFFNVRDRKHESLFIANLVYPNSRVVETMDNYIRNEDTGNILLRSAYNNGIEDISYFAGLKSKSLLSSDAIVSSTEMAMKLESAIMATGYFLARNGFLSQRNATGISHAKNLLIAAKQGGQDNTNEDHEGMGSLGEMAMTALKEIKGPEMEAKLDKYVELEMAKSLEMSGEEKEEK